MEPTRNFDLNKKYSRRATTFAGGIVIREGNAVATDTNDNTIDLNREPQPSPTNTTTIDLNRKPQPSPKGNADHALPINNVMRIMRDVLPLNATIDEDAKEAMEECAHKFISYITHEANEKCRQEYRRTVTPEDVLAAMEALDFRNYVEYLSKYLAKRRGRNLEQGGSSNAPTVYQQHEAAQDDRMVASSTALPYRPGGFCDLLLNPNRNPFDEDF